MTRPSNAALELLHEIAAELSSVGPVEVGSMFRSPGIRTHGTIVAFLGGEDRLILKIARERAVALVADGTASEVTMGTRTMREWIQIASDPAHPVETRALWLQLSREAFEYVSGRDEP
jgi:TfoX/Sxy family transcriptional regulator of competence genes